MSTVQLLKAAEFIPLSDVRSLVGQPLQLSVPEGQITKEGIRLILEYLDEVYPGVELPSPKNTERFSWIWLDTKQGTLPKRMSKWLKKKLVGMSPDQKVIAHVGNLARQNSDNSQTYYFRIVDKIDWSAEQFGKIDGGCWWGCGGSNRSGGRPEADSYADRFTKNDGLGVQFFQNDRYDVNSGIGRIWLYIDPDFRFATTFNGYWANEGATLRLTRVLASYLGLSYRKCESLSADFSVYINDSIGYYIGDELILSSRKHEVYRIPKKVVRKPCTRCTLLTDEEILRGYDNLCIPCFQTTRKRCPNCYLNKDASKFQQVRTNQGLVDWCGVCVLNHAVTCGGCQAANIAYTFNYPGCVLVDEQYMCTKCTMSSRKCQDCGKRTLDTDAMDDALCLACEQIFEDEIRIDDELEGVTVRPSQPHIIFNLPDSERLRVAIGHSNEAFARLRSSLENAAEQIVRQATVNLPAAEEQNDEDFDIPF